MAVNWAIEQGFLATFSLLSFILVSIPLAWHFEAWNVGCVLYIFWTGLTCLIQFINHMVWWDTAVNLAPAWCEITIRFTFIARVGLVSASLLIARRLSIITTGSVVTTTYRDKQRAVLIDLAIGLFPPFAQLITLYFIQGHRFDIYEGVGCQVAIPLTWLAIVLATCWPLPIGLVSIYYCTRTLRAFMQRRKDFKSLLKANKNLTFNIYVRLISMAIIEIASTVPITIFIIIRSAQNASYKYIGFADLHFGFSEIRLFPTGIWLNIPGVQFSFELTEWLFIGSALVFFLLFGFAEEARKHYRNAYESVAKRLGISTGTVSETTAFTDAKKSKLASAVANMTLPSFVIQRTIDVKRDTIGSYGNRFSAPLSVSPFGPFDDLENLDEGSDNDSSTYAGSQLDEKVLPQVPGSQAQSVVDDDLESAHSHRQTPDVPSAVRDSVQDMV